MSFERCRDSIIEDFITDCEECNLLTRQEIEENREEILERFEEHRECYKHKSEFDNEDLDIMGTVVYGDYSNVAIECNQCNTILIDSKVLEGDE